ncbi:hypothetical protein SDC9_60224 [bioreactor metagenome]|uniref:Uncharacterized protein n=1 Tax=bioreactor metagenome TaxID=1076179 RepID=A0A644XID5_9ZZZZ
MSCSGSGLHQVGSEILQDRVRRRVRVGPSVAHIGRDRVEMCPALAQEPLADIAQGQRLDLRPGPVEPARLPGLGLLGVFPVGLDLVDELADPLALAGHRPDDRRLPVVRAELGQGDHVAQLPDQRLGAVPVRLVDHEDVGDLEDARLGGLDRVPHARGVEDKYGVGRLGDLHLGLADPDRLDDDGVEAGGVEDPQCLGSGGGQAAEMAAGRHRPDVDVGIEGVLLHPDPVAEHRATGERGGRVDRQHADPLPAGAQLGDQGRCARRLADAGRPGDPDDVTVTGVGSHQLHRLAQRGRVVLDQRDQASQRPRLALPGPLDELGHGGLGTGHWARPSGVA